MTGRPTLADVARRAGVSASTASVVYSGRVATSERTRHRVLAAAAELGYSGPDPRAAGLRKGRSGVVGVVVVGELRSAFLDPVTVPTLDGIAHAIAPSGSGLLLLRDDPSTGGLTLETAPVDAVVLLGCGLDLGAALDTLRTRGIPVVMIEGDAADDIPRIEIDSLRAQRQLACHVRSIGHERVALVTLPLDAPGSSIVAGAARDVHATRQVTRERLDGARQVFPDATVVTAPDSTIDAGVVAGRLIFHAAERPTAVLAQSDLLAAGVLRAAQEAGLRIPEDVSITGFDGVRVDGIAPYELTTMVQPAFDKGVAAGQALLRLLDGEPSPTIRFACTFREGNTTAPPA